MTNVEVGGYVAAVVWLVIGVGVCIWADIVVKRARRGR